MRVSWQEKRVPPARATGKTTGFRETYSSERTPALTHESVQNDLGRKFRGLFADRSYALETYRRLLRERGITPHIGRHGVADGSGLGTIRWVGEDEERSRPRLSWRACYAHITLAMLAAAYLAATRATEHEQPVEKGDLEPAGGA